jgi:predicted nuclease with TOPRIM domain
LFRFFRAEDGSLLRVSRSGPQLVDYTVYYNQKLDEIRALHEEDRKLIEQQRQLIEEMQKEISFLQYTNHLLVEKFQLDLSGYEKFRAEQLAAKNQNNVTTTNISSISNTNNSVNTTQYSTPQVCQTITFIFSDNRFLTLWFCSGSNSTRSTSSYSGT